MKNNYMKVVLGISGGIDSSIAGLILKKQGFDVHGVFMKNWDIADETGYCSVNEDFQDAARTCSILGITLHEINFSKEYWNYVFTDLVDSYQNGLTPNPDVLCNKYIKFDKFLNYAFNNLEADAVATGHYAQTSFGPFLEHADKSKGVHLLRAVDELKDQTLFLNQVHQNALQNVMFPLGTLKKIEVKKIAEENKLDHVIKKKESTGICFIGHRSFPKFISEYIPDKPGTFINIDTGQVIGTHRGIHHWTLGQRTRFGGLEGRYYIVRKIPDTQDMLVALGKRHLSLWSSHFTTSTPHWIHSMPEDLKRGGILKCAFRFQHAQPLTPCHVMMTDNDALIIISKQPLFALTPGQYAALYNGNECLGGAKIENIGPSLFNLSKYTQEDLFQS